MIQKRGGEENLFFKKIYIPGSKLPVSSLYIINQILNHRNLLCAVDYF